MPTNYEVAKQRLYNSQKCNKLCSEPPCFNDCKKECKEEKQNINECCEEVYNTEKDCKFHILFQNIICNLFNSCQKDKISKIFEILEQLINKNHRVYLKIVDILKDYEHIYNIEIYQKIINRINVKSDTNNLIRTLENGAIIINNIYNNIHNIDFIKKITFCDYHKDNEITELVLLLKLIKCFN